MYSNFKEKAIGECRERVPVEDVNKEASRDSGGRERERKKVALRWFSIVVVVVVRPRGTTTTEGLSLLNLFLSLSFLSKNKSPLRRIRQGGRRRGQRRQLLQGPRALQGSARVLLDAPEVREEPQSERGDHREVQGVSGEGRVPQGRRRRADRRGRGAAAERGRDGGAEGERGQGRGRGRRRRQRQAQGAALVGHLDRCVFYLPLFLCGIS